MCKRLLCSLVLISASLSTRAHAEVYWTANFENNVDDWDGGINHDSGNLTFLTDPVIEGTYSASVTVSGATGFGGGQSRVDFRWNDAPTENGEDTYVSWFFMVPEAVETRSNIGQWESDGSFLNTTNIHIEGEDGKAEIVFGTGDLGQTERWRDTLVIGEWHHIAWHIHWSQGEDGKTSLWYDGKQVADAVELRKRDGNRLFLQIGLQRSYQGGPDQTLYLDGALAADTLEEVLAPAALLGGPLAAPDADGGVGGGASASSGAGGAGGAGGAISSAAGGKPAVIAAAGAAGSIVAPTAANAGAAGNPGPTAGATGGTNPTNGGACAVTSTTERSAGFGVALWLMGGFLLWRRARRQTCATVKQARR